MRSSISFTIFILLVLFIPPRLLTTLANANHENRKERECKRCKCKLDGSEFGVSKEIDPRCDEGSGIKAVMRGVKGDQARNIV